MSDNNVWGVFLRLVPGDEHLELMSVHRTKGGAEKYKDDEIEKERHFIETHSMKRDIVSVRDDEHWFVYELQVRD